MHYSFRRIQTEDLQRSVDYYEEHRTIACLTIHCDQCPLRKKACGCVRKPFKVMKKQEKYELFRDELNYRKDDEMEDWKELDIRNMPSDFFVNDDYEFQSNKKEKLSEWNTVYTNTFHDKVCLLKWLKRGDCKQRYRLKPLEPIRITQNELEILALYYTNYVGKNTEAETDDLAKRINRPVQLID